MHILLIYLHPLDNEPMGLMYIGTALKKAGHQVKIIGIETHNTQRRLLKEALNFKPDVVGLNITTALANKAQYIAGLIKNNFSEITIIAGGPHPTILPYEVLKEKNIDICVIGEGEITAVDLLKALVSSRQALEEVKGIAFLRNGDLKVTPGREYIQDLDTLPFVDRELMPKDVIYGRAGYPVGNPCMFLLTARGCPYQCSFCQPTVDKIFGKKVRRRSPENVIQEIIGLKKKYGIHGLWINDDTFLLDNNWTQKFCDLIIREKLDILWCTNGRIDNANEEVLTKMRDAGCVTLVLTPEAGSQRIRNSVFYKNVFDEEIVRVYRLCHKIGLPAQANIMLGSPTETERDLSLSFALIKKIQPHSMNFSYTTALPGTYLHERYTEDIASSPYYQSYENYDIGTFKKFNNTDISDEKLRTAWDFFDTRYSKFSFTNRARQFFRYPYFRKIIFKRWKTLLCSRHPKFRHFLFDLLAITLGSFTYFKNRRLYDADPKIDTVKN